MKLVRQEDESDALRTWLTGSPAEGLVSSELGRVEVLRAGRRLGVEYLVRAGSLLGDIDLVPLDRPTLDFAADVGAPLLRTLDALHLASALVLGENLTAFVTYDHRLGASALVAGLPVHSPGAPPA